MERVLMLWKFGLEDFSDESFALELVEDVAFQQ